MASNFESKYTVGGSIHVLACQLSVTSFYLASLMVALTATGSPMALHEATGFGKRRTVLYRVLVNFHC